MLPKTVCMISCLHSLFDDRIYWKECVSLTKHGYQVIHIGVGNEDSDHVTAEGLRVVSIKKKIFSTNRMLHVLCDQLFCRRQSTMYLLLKAASEFKADVYHFHDLQINRIAVQLKKMPHHPIVVYDVHEPYPTFIMSKSGSPARRLFNYVYGQYVNYWELAKAKHYDSIITTEPNVQHRFIKALTPDKVHVIYNYSNLIHVPQQSKDFDFIYCGGITVNRGIFEMIDALKELHQLGVHANLLILGNFHEPATQQKAFERIDEYQLSQYITYVPQVGYHQVSDYYTKCRIGLCLFRKTLNNETIMPIKIFEYIKMRLPVIGSNIGHIAKITSQYHTGVLVDPRNSYQVAIRMKQLLENLDLQDKLRSNCDTASDLIDWKRSEEQLLRIYSQF